ncbi:MAG: hypothetical protein WCF20_13840 [Methylovirgula sp.]
MEEQRAAILAVLHRDGRRRDSPAYLSATNMRRVWRNCRQHALGVAQLPHGMAIYSQSPSPHGFFARFRWRLIDNPDRLTENLI